MLQQLKFAYPTLNKMILVDSRPGGTKLPFLDSSVLGGGGGGFASLLPLEPLVNPESFTVNFSLS